VRLDLCSGCRERLVSLIARQHLEENAGWPVSLYPVAALAEQLQRTGTCVLAFCLKWGDGL